MDKISCQESIDVENDLDVKVDIDYDDDITTLAPPLDDDIQPRL